MGAPTKFIDALSYFELLSSPSTFKLKTGLSEKEYENFLSYFRRCDIRPFDSAVLNTPVRPEARVWLEKGEVKLEVFSFRNFNFRINKFYLKHASNKELRKFILEKYQRALSLKRAIEQRKETLEKVIKAIFEKQKEFLFDGKSLKPLTLSEVSERVSLHESTISRCVSRKFVETPFGIYPLKFFFPKGNKEQTTDEIKQMIREIIENEDKRKPLSDEKISRILKERGFKIARRTVAKYRESLGIPGAFGRKIR
ncbi:RNA polymerase sigma-54 factor [Balnearium lithotrophicum]|uniref:RNA polymerase sigma-54 factor n=1 Tax=Balnearium lithotrophicum TaxID=223788 RepID=A0A521AJG7_9BACT|nr:RNA polymerase sigma-54 factor [Balnearium lithotrophicum]